MIFRMETRMTSENTRELPDTVENAAATPGQDMPWKELGLKEDEYQRICDILGRRPTNAELAMYSVMWSEHCSYKSSKKRLSGQFGARTTDAMRKNLLVGMGQNAGVVDIGGGWAVTFKVESHNHPSFVEPYQGAATGVGGIVRDIISMGARPIAVMDQLRFGAVDHPDTARVVHGVVSGVGGYGNCLGLPNIGGETEFDPSYQGNPLVNALCIGKLRHDDIHLANATGEGNLVVLFGARTGGDGIRASSPVGDDHAVKTPFGAQNVGQQMLVFVGVGSVCEVVGAHDCSRLGAAAHDFETGQIDLTQRALVHNGIRRHASQLLGVSGEVLGAGCGTRGLDSFDEAGGHATGQDRVFGEVLEVASAQDAAVQVEGGGEPEVNAEALHLGPDDVAELLGQHRVPGLGERGADGDGSGVLLTDLGGFAGFWLVGDAEGLTSGVVHEVEEGGGQAGVTQGEGALGVDSVGGGQAQAGGPVGHDDAGQAGDPGGGLARRADDAGDGVDDARAVRARQGENELRVFSHGRQSNGSPRTRVRVPGPPPVTHTTDGITQHIVAHKGGIKPLCASGVV